MKLTLITMGNRLNQIYFRLFIAIMNGLYYCTVSINVKPFKPKIKSSYFMCVPKEFK